LWDCERHSRPKLSMTIVRVMRVATFTTLISVALILVYDFHPNSTTVWEEHLDPNPDLSAQAMNGVPRRRQGMPIPERQLWSYITQIANALKAMHSSGLAARNLDPSKMLITGKNRCVIPFGKDRARADSYRIRLNGCGILDVLAYDGNTPITVYQVSYLKLFSRPS
jgi:PAB-dependent poly(A)-specific ribonuclease subunit 3